MAWKADAACPQSGPVYHKLARGNREEKHVLRSWDSDFGDGEVPVPWPLVILHALAMHQEPGKKWSGVRLCGWAGRKQQEQARSHSAGAAQRDSSFPCKENPAARYGLSLDIKPYMKAATFGGGWMGGGGGVSPHTPQAQEEFRPASTLSASAVWHKWITQFGG